MRTKETHRVPERLTRSNQLFLLVGALMLFPGVGFAQTGVPWAEADKLFRSDPRWLGADGAFSVDLGDDQVLWMFGDTFVARKRGDTRRHAAFIHNTVGIQTRYDPSHASIKFYWRTRKGVPAEIFPSEGHVWMWPSCGIHVGGRLLLFCTRVTPEHKIDSLGFQLAGWIAYVVVNPNKEPSAWALQKAAEDNGKVIMASAALHEGGFVYLFGASEPEHDVYLARCRIGEVERGRLDELEWWSGSGWELSESERKPVIRAVGTEFSVQRNPCGGFLEVNSQGFGASDIVMRTAPRLEGPWGAPRTIYRPPESNAPGAFVYAGKSHPELQGGNIVITYVANGSDERLATDMSIYFPRFVRVQMTDCAAAAREK